MCERNGFEFEGIDDIAYDVLRAHAWRGNIRELRNLVETLVTLGQGSRITAEQVQNYIRPERDDNISDYPTNALVHIPQPAVHANVHANVGGADPATGLLYQSLLQLQADVGSIKQAFSALVERLADMPFRGPVSSEEDELGWDKKDLSIEAMEKRMILLALKRFHGSRRNAARALGLSERTLYRKMQEYGLEEVE